MSGRTAAYFTREISWLETDDAEFPYEANMNTEHLKIRVNDFPEEPLYTLFINETPGVDFDDWPDLWRREPSERESDHNHCNH